MHSEQQSIAQKTNKFRIEIRKQKISKIFALKRIKPQPINSDFQALQIVLDGVQILENGPYDQEILVKVLRSIANVFKRYIFDESHEKLLKKILSSVSIFFIDSIDFSYRQTIKQAALQLISVLSFFSQRYGVSLSHIPFQVLNGYNLQMIKSCLLALGFLLNQGSSKQDFHENMRFLKNNGIIYKLLKVFNNFSKTSECFNTIKPLFVGCATFLCSINYMINIFPIDPDEAQLLNICFSLVEEDIVKQANNDPILSVYFERFYENKDISQVYEKTHQLRYPFGVYSSLLRIIKQPSHEVVIKLIECLIIQIQNVSVEECLVRCLSKIYYESEQKMQKGVKEQIFAYIFGLEYANNNKNNNELNSQSLRYMIVMMLNEHFNSQNGQVDIVKYMGDGFSKRWPNTDRLLKVMEYLEEREDYVGQQKLLELVEQYLTIRGEDEVLNECVWELVRFGEGKKWLEVNGYIKEEMEEMERGGDGEGEWEI